MVGLGLEHQRTSRLLFLYLHTAACVLFPFPQPRLPAGSLASELALILLLLECHVDCFGGAKLPLSFSYTTSFKTTISVVYWLPVESAMSHFSEPGQDKGAAKLWSAFPGSS